MIKLTSIVISLVFTGLAFAETREFNLSEISEIEVNNTSGNVNITAVDQGKATVSAEKKKFGEHCEMTIAKKGTTLLVQVKKAKLFGRDCEVDFNITAPRTVNLDLDSGNGDMNIKGTVGNLDFNVGNGSVEVEAEVKKLDGKSGNGAIFIKGLTTGGSLRTGSGKIALIYDVAPASGDLDIKTGSGDAEIVLPKTAKIRTAFSAGRGNLTNELGDTSDSKFQISMKAGSGSLHIKKQ